MVLWTVMPMDAVFPEEFSPKYEQIEFNGVKLEVERISYRECRIVRILSSNPQDFLRQDIQPNLTIAYN